MTKRKSAQPVQQIPDNKGRGCLSRLWKYTQYTLMGLGACFIITVGLAIFAPDSNETAIPTLRVIPNATATNVLDTPTSTNIPLIQGGESPVEDVTEALEATPTEPSTVANAASASEELNTAAQVFINEDGVQLHVDSIMVLNATAEMRLENGVALALLARIENPTNSSQCVTAGNIRLLLDAIEYEPQGRVMSAAKETIGRDYTGGVLGHCVSKDEAEDTFIAFDVPSHAEHVSVRFGTDEQVLDVPWALQAYPVNQSLGFDALPPLATEYFIARETLAAAATMTATHWTQTPTATVTNTPLPTNTATITNTPRPTNTSRPTDAPRPTARPAGTTMYSSNGDVRVRECPRTDCAVVTTLERGEAITAFATVQGASVSGNSTWREIDFNGRTVYVHSSLIQSSRPAPIVQPQTSSSGGSTTSTQNQSVAPPPAANFSCNCSKTCDQMASCEEAYFQLNQCGCRRRDGDGDSVPCEDICPGG